MAHSQVFQSRKVLTEDHRDVAHARKRFRVELVESVHRALVSEKPVRAEEKRVDDTQLEFAQRVVWTLFHEDKDLVPRRRDLGFVSLEFVCSQARSARSFSDHPSNRDLLTWTDAEGVARLHLFEWNVLLGAGQERENGGVLRDVAWGATSSVVVDPWLFFTDQGCEARTLTKCARGVAHGRVLWMPMSR
jgi:hypothetical protein